MRYSHNKWENAINLADISFYYDDRTNLFVRDGKTGISVSSSHSFDAALGKLYNAVAFFKKSNQWQNVVNNTTKTRKICKDVITKDLKKNKGEEE